MTGFRSVLFLLGLTSEPVHAGVNPVLLGYSGALFASAPTTASAGRRLAQFSVVGAAGRRFAVGVHAGAAGREFADPPVTGNSGDRQD